MTAPQSVVEIGSTGIRLLVAVVDSRNAVTILDHSEMPVALGRDVFTNGFISTSTQHDCILILSRFVEQLASWGISPEGTKVIATSAFREAKNRDPVMDHIKIKTGLTVRVIDGIEENRLMYIAINESLKQEAKKVRKDDAMIVEVGGGSTEIMLMRKGKMAGAHSLRLGTIRVEQQIRSLSVSFDDIQRYVNEFLRSTKGSLESEINLHGVKQFLAVGSDVTIAALIVGKPISPWLRQIERDVFDKFVDEVQQYSIEECTAKFKISYNEAQTLHISLLIHRMFIHLTNVQTILVPETNIRYGLLISENTKHGNRLQKEFVSQITASAFNLLRKYHGDERHAEYVRKTSVELFSLLEKEIALDERAKTLLEVSAILHDIGNFIQVDNHNLHSEYIIKNSEIFGLAKNENRIISLIAKYHRGKEQPQDNESFQLLSRSDRMTILKLTSVLRIADALDRGHAQGMIDFSISMRNDTLILHTKQRDTALEKIALEEKADMFETVFGYKFILE